MPDPAVAAVLAQVGHGDIIPHRHAKDQTDRAAVFTDVSDALVKCVTAAADAKHLAVHGYGTSGKRIEAEDRTHDLRPSCAHQSGYAEDLTAVQAEADISEPAAGQMLHAEEFFRCWGIALWEHVLDLAADHHGDERRLFELLTREAADVAAVTHDGHAVCDAEDLVHLVRDVDDRNVFFLELVNDTEQNFNLFRGDRRGRLVHDQYPRIVGNSADDLNHLLLRYTQIAHLTGRIQMDFHLIQKLLRLLQHLLLLQPLAGDELPTQEDVIRYGKRRHVVQLLMDHRNTKRSCVIDRTDLDQTAIHIDLTAVFLVRAVDDVHQRRFSCAVFAHQCVDLTGVNLQLHFIERFHARERLGNSLQFQNNLTHRQHLSALLF